MSYRRCDTSIPEMMRMIDIEVGELDDINNELADGNVDVTEIDRRYRVVLLLTLPLISSFIF